MFRNVLSQPFFLCSFGLFAIGWFISFICACIFGRGATGAWITVFYNLFILVGSTAAVNTNSVQSYRLVILTFLSGSLVLTISSINSHLYSYPLNGISNPVSASSNGIAAGMIFQSFVIIFWVFFFGVENDTIVKRTIDSFVIPKSGGGIGNDGINGVGVLSNVQQTPPTTEPMTSIVVPAASEYSYKARALYSYEANPEDPNELGFVKGEILDIVDNKGKWWQARKGDGTTGIAPSNYLQLI